MRATHGIVVGGDYKHEAQAIANAAITTDGGASWSLVKGLGGYRSAVAHLPSSSGSALRLIAVGPTGADYSVDDGRTWTPTGPIAGLHAISVARGGRIVWGVGEDGRIARLRW